MIISTVSVAIIIADIGFRGHEFQNSEKILIAIMMTTTTTTNNNNNDNNNDNDDADLRVEASRLADPAVRVCYSIR